MPWRIFGNSRRRPLRWGRRLRFWRRISCLGHRRRRRRNGKSDGRWMGWVEWFYFRVFEDIFLWKWNALLYNYLIRLFLWSCSIIHTLNVDSVDAVWPLDYISNWQFPLLSLRWFIDIFQSTPAQLKSPVTVLLTVHTSVSSYALDDYKYVWRHRPPL